MNKVYPTLYSKDSLDNTRVWYVIQNGVSYTITSGLYNGGDGTTTEPVVCLPKNVGKKNETSGEEQATKEIEALYTKKKKGKYYENIADIEEGNRYFAPMLAKQWEDYSHKVKFPVVVQCKFNGARCIATKDGLFTRKGERYISIPHIWEEIKWVFDKWPDAVLDGELYNFDLRQKLNELMSLVRKSKDVTPEELEQSRQTVQYHIYDGFLYPATKDKGYLHRQAEINKAAQSKYCKMVPSFSVNNEAELNGIYQTYLESGEEGVIIRTLDVGYENKRSSSLLKYKPTDDAEFTIIEVERGLGNWSAGAKTITLRTDDSKEFRANFKGSMEESVQMWKDKDWYIGKRVTIYYNGLTGLGTPNYAQFDYNNSIKE